MKNLFLQARAIFQRKTFYTTIILLAVLLFFGGLLLFLIVSAEKLVVLSDILLPIYNALATAGLFYAYVHARRHARRDQRAWLFIAISQLIFTFADLLWGIYELVLHQQPFPSLVDGFYFLVYPFFLLGIALFPYEDIKARESRKLALELLIVMAVAGLYLNNFVLKPLMADMLSSDFWTRLFSLAYPLLDFFLLLALFYLMYRRIQVFHPDAVRLLLASMAATLVADIAFVAANLGGSYTAERLLDYFYPASYLLIGMAGVVSTLPLPIQRRNLIRIPHARLHRYISSFMLASAFILLFAGYFRGLAISFLELTFWVGGVVVLSILLQLVDAQDIDGLNMNLSQMNIDLEKHVEKRTFELAHALDELLVSETLYRAVVEDLPVFICRFKKNGILTFVNQAYSEYVGQPREELVGKSFFTLIPETEREYVRDRFQSLSHDKPMISYEHQVITTGGEIRWQRWIDRAIFEDDELIEFQSIGEDITEQRNAQQALRESEERFRDLFDNSTNLIEIVSPEWKFIFVNEAWKKQLGYSESEIEKLAAWDVFHRESQEHVRQAFERSLTGEVVSDLEAVFVTRDYKLVYTEGNINCKITDGKPEYIRAIFHDITERKKVQEQLYLSAYYDPLTGLPNRAFLLDRLNQMLSASAKGDKHHYGLFFLDIDNFKLVNDTLGHAVGDQLLIAFGARLKECLRTFDIIARLGGDEFVILLDRVSKLDDVEDVAHRIINKLEQPFFIDGEEIMAHASIGLVYDFKSGDAQSILRDADIAMYRAKVMGKNRFEIFQEHLREDTISRVRLENELRRAIQENQFFLEYQPIYSLKTNQVQGVEALLRWEHPNQGVLPPLYFIPIAEETGLITQIGEWVLREACHQMATWQRSFPQAASLQVSVNLSARQLVQKELKDIVHEVLQETGLPPACLALEITETTIMENIELISQLLEDLHKEGIQIQVDDFGIGYSSLFRLQNLPIQALKIDRSFIRDAGLPGSNKGIVRAIAMMGKELHLATIAEGIEKEQELDLLKALDCDAGQGYYLGKPMKAQQFVQHLETMME
jgi:diguanylate cyclase (GGDEF)-like protein/PAS domain S-box-containing protein